MTGFLKKATFTVLAGLICISAFPQQKGKRTDSWFVDGFHGGVYGHYPLETYTDYMMSLLDRYPDWSMCLEIEPETWDSVKVVAPASYEKFKLAALGDRVECTNPTYAQPYMYNIPGESIIRQFHYGIRKMHQHFPEMEFSTYAVEEPCFTSALPQILRGFGFKYASLKCPNTCWGGYYAPVDGEIVNWTGPDGSSVLCSPRYSFEELSRENVFSTLANNNCEEYLDAAAREGYTRTVGMTYQDAGWEFGPWLESQWKDFGDKHPVSSRYTTWKKYFENVANDVAPVDYVSSQEDVRVALMWGTQVLQRIARSVRTAEKGILKAEKMGVMANIANGFHYDEARIDEGWRTLLLSQHHDSWIVPYNNLKDRGSWADWICRNWTVSTGLISEREISKAKYSYNEKGRHESDKHLKLRVFNTDGNARGEVLTAVLPSRLSGRKVAVCDAQGNAVESVTDFVDGETRLLFKAEVPAFGYASYEVRADGDIRQERRMPYQATTLENDMYRIVFDRKRGGVIKSIIAKKDGGRELVEKGEYAFGEIKGYFYDEGRFISSADAAATVTIVEDNRFEKKARISGMIGPHPFVETITLRAGDELIDLNLSIDWQGNPGIGKARQEDAYANPERAFYDDRYHLNIYFPSALTSPELYKSAPFDVCKSGLEDTSFSNWHDIKHNVILDWVSLEGEGRGFGLMTDHTTSYVQGGGRPLALTVQSSGNGLWGRDYRIDGPTVMNIAIHPHMGGWQSAAEAYRSWNEPLDYAFSADYSLENASLLDCAGYELSAAYLDGNDVVIRLFNHSLDEGVRNVKVDGSVSSVEEIDLLGNCISRVEIKDGRFEVSMPRFGFRTYRLSRNRVDYTHFVDTRIGTDSEFALSHGNTYPATGMPFGQHLWSVRTGDEYDGWKYSWKHSEIRGFEQCHQCSPWMSDYAVYMLMPEIDTLVTDLKKRGAPFSHKNENARPQCYSVKLDNGINASMSATERTAFLRFEYPEGHTPYLVLDGYNMQNEFNVSPDNMEITGWVNNCRHMGDVKDKFRCWVVIRFDKPFREYGDWKNGMYLRFDDGVEVNVRTSSSYISLEQARTALRMELGSMENIDEVCAHVRNAWNDVLGKIDVSGASEEELRTFYCCLFRSNLFSRKFYELKEDGKPYYFSPYDGGIHDGYMFTDNGFWDTFRSQFPLTVILHPEMQGRYMQALLDAYDQMGWLPQWSQPGETGGMVGNHAISLLADAWAKGIRTFDPGKALDAYYHEATNKGPWGGANGRGGYEDYWKLGYVSHSGGGDGAVAMTLEYAYDDFCAFKLAESTGNTGYMDIFGKSMYNYRNVFDPVTGFMRGKDRKGKWVEPFDPTAWGNAYVEGDAWHYTWSVFQDVQGLINLFGSDERFVAKLDSVFTVPPVMNKGSYWEIIHEMVEMELADMGQYAHGNQPIQHMPYLYNYAGQPWKTQYWVRRIMRELYNSGPQGYPGDEDQGGMSSWYVLSALGIYAVTPGTDQYVIGSPVFRKARMTLDNGNAFTIRADNNSPDNVYIQAAWLNGKPLETNYIRYRDIMNGGELHLIMGDTPATSRNTGKEASPFSLTRYK